MFSSSQVFEAWLSGDVGLISASVSWTSPLSSHNPLTGLGLPPPSMQLQILPALIHQGSFETKMSIQASYTGDGGSSDVFQNKSRKTIAHLGTTLEP